MKPEIVFFYFFGFLLGGLSVLADTFEINIITSVGESFDLFINNFYENLKNIRHFINNFLYDNFKNIRYFNEFFKCYENSTELTEVTKLKDSIITNDNFTNESDISDICNPYTENSILTTRNLVFLTGGVVVFVGLAIFFSTNVG